MSESPAHYRCACQKCQKVLKIRTDWAGRRGVCPHCQATVEFPPFKGASAGSATGQLLLKLMAEADEATFDEGQTERLALLLSQGTCRDFQLAAQWLNGRPLSARQWRRTLNAADVRESMRRKLQERVAAEAELGNDAEPAALAASTEAAPNAWKVLARFLYFQRHGVCPACQNNATGMECIYLTFDSFVAGREISAGRVEHWHVMLHNHLGL